jgi:hypothetical protein
MVSFGQNDFILNIGNDSYEIALDENNRLDINGETFVVSIKEKDTLQYDDSLYSFKYVKNHSVSKTVLNGGIE